ncbi:MAG: hypothetical protein ABEJ83_05345 [Candidatus Nanohaloarchaea archaeon]
MNRKNILAIFIIAATVVASGCGGNSNQNTPSTSPIKIQDFSAFPNPVPAGQTVQFNIELKNKGDVDAQNVAFRLFNPPFGTSGQKRTWRGVNRDLTSTGGRTLSTFNTLRAPTENNPAIPATATISMTAPEIGQGNTISYTFLGKLFYTYNTSAQTEIQVMSQERFRESGVARKQPSVDTSSGPIQLDVRTATPIIQYSGDTGPNSEMCVIVRNKGSGTPFLVDGSNSALTGSDRVYNVNDSNADKVKLTVHDVGNFDLDANPETDTDKNSVTVKLVGSKGIQCFGIDQTDSVTEGSGQKTYNVQMEAKYGYTRETSTAVTVEGRRQ